MCPTAECPVRPRHRLGVALGGSLLLIVAGVAGCSRGAPSPSSTRDTQDIEGCVTATLRALPLEGQVGQVLMVGVPVDNPQDLADVAGRYGLGGAFLAGRSSGSAAAHRQAIQELQRRAVAAKDLPLHVAIDQEGGRVQTLQGVDFPPIPSAVEQGRWDQSTLQERTRVWARRLADIGVTMDLAPVADTVPSGTAGDNPPIGALDRQYGDTPETVADRVATVVSAIQAEGVVATVKHFPGLGRVHANTDTSTEAVDEITNANDPFLTPFARGIQAGAVVMVSSARYPRLDPDNVAVFSTPIVTGLLRQRLGYSGLVISDDMGNAAAVAAVPVGQRAVRFLRAGGDMVLTVRRGDVEAMSAALVDEARGSPQFRARVFDAAEHVIRTKYRAGLLTCPAPGSAR